MQKSSLKKRFRYYFDNTLSSGTISLIGWLAMATFGIILLAAFLIALMNIPQDDKTSVNFGEAIWISLMRVLDTGNVASDNGWLLRIVTLIVTLSGIFLVSILIGILTSSLQDKIYELRKGRSTILEEGHIVILGWSSKIIPILAELVLADENLKNSCIVVMAEKDKVEMEDEIRTKVDFPHKTSIICRTGNTIDPHDLSIASVDTARSIVILSPENEMADMFVIKTLLALVGNPNRKKEKYHIVAEILNEEKLEIAQMVGKDEAVYIYPSDLIARIILQSCRHSGLSIIYQNLLSFVGVEFYFFDEPALKGKTFKEAMFAYNDSVAVGICHGEQGIELNPSFDKIISPGDRLILIAENDDSIRISKENFTTDKTSVVFKAKPTGKIEKTLLLGWNEKGNSLIQQIDKYVVGGSEITVLTNSRNAENDFEKIKGGILNQKIEFKIGDTTDKTTLYDLNVPSYDHVIILSYSNEMKIQEADAITLITLLYLRQIAEQCDYSFSIVSEMVDAKNRQLMVNTQADDFIVSNKLVSLMIAQLSENSTLKLVFDDLFNIEGSEIYLRPASNYVKENTEVNFYTIMESAIEHKEIAIGYRIHKYYNDPSKEYGMVLNPLKSEMVSFTASDKIIVIARE